jgi:Tfp pilus assembly protein PilN
MSVAEPVQKTAAAAPPPAVRHEDLNLARRPFVNTRPTVRAALILWLLGLLLLLGNVTLFWSYLGGSGEMRAELDETERRVEQERQKARQTQKKIDSYELAKQNEQVEYLNRKIAERTFSWSLLFDRIAEALPDDVRLTRLAPEGMAQDEDRPGFRRNEADDGSVLLTISGNAKSDEAINRFVDNLFDHPFFRDPNPSREARDAETGQLEFDMTVRYLPGTSAPAGVYEIEEATPTPAPSVATPVPGPAAPGAFPRSAAPRSPTGGRP